MCQCNLQTVMAHKLLIQAIYTFSDRQYLSNVGTREFPRGAEVNVIITMKNLGKSLFSGGRLPEIAASFDETAFGGAVDLSTD
jgi:phosphatidylserine/phosphatidylglycerophosphate/cardiolipin synthase-like enzyme